MSDIPKEECHCPKCVPVKEPKCPLCKDTGVRVRRDEFGKYEEVCTCIAGQTSGPRFG